MITKKALRLASMKRMISANIDLMTEINATIADYDSAMIQAGMKTEFDAWIQDLRTQYADLDSRCDDLSMEIGLLQAKMDSEDMTNAWEARVS
jgi:hypothetical protein